MPGLYREYTNNEVIDQMFLNEGKGFYINRDITDRELQQISITTLERLFPNLDNFMDSNYIQWLRTEFRCSVESVQQRLAELAWN